MARWVNKMRWLIAGLGAAVSAGTSFGAQVQDGAFTELYGYGVHRYYAGDYHEAQRAFNIVIEAGIEDPRPHYFRGLVTYQMGSPEGATADFEHAAELEARGTSIVNINQALSRIQGPVRRDIEMARMMARVAVAQEQRAKKQMDAAQAEASGAIGKPPAGNDAPPSVSAEPPAAPATPATPPATPPADPTAPAAPATPDTQNDPFKDDAAVPPPATPETPSADPFGAAPAPATPPASDDPFK